METFRFLLSQWFSAYIWLQCGQCWVTMGEWVERGAAAAARRWNLSNTRPTSFSCPLTVIIHTAVGSRVRCSAAELLPPGDPPRCSLAVLFSVHLRGRVICTFLERPCLLICLKYRQIGHAFLLFWSKFMLKQRIQMTCQWQSGDLSQLSLKLEPVLQAGPDCTANWNSADGGSEGSATTRRQSRPQHSGSAGAGGRGPGGGGGGTWCCKTCSPV